MAQQGKSYRQGQSVAPYREPLKSPKISKSSFFFKIKTLLDKKMNLSLSTPKESVGQPASTKMDDNGTNRMARIPGGFFSPENSSTSIHMPKRRSLKPKDPVNVSFAESQRSLDDETNESCAADISNAKLADFFREKGNRPLSDMEMEGVISLMRRSNSTTSSRRSSITNLSVQKRGNDDLLTSRVLKSSRAPSVASSSLKPPTFVPKYENSSGPHSVTNVARSVSSRKRVFDYTNLPSPYRTTVYKYSAADSRAGSRSAKRVSSSSLASSSSVDQVTTSSSFGGDLKKLSNTASALVSLLDGSSSDREAISQLANPYSAHVRKYKKVPSGPRIRQDPSSESEDPQKNDNNAQIVESSNNKSRVERLAKQVQSPSDKYKPLRSSSLRTGIEIKEQNSDITKQREETQTKSSLPTSSRFTFEYNNIDRETAKTRPAQSEESETNVNAQFGTPNHSEPSGSCSNMPSDKIPQNNTRAKRQLDQGSNTGLGQRQSQEVEKLPFCEYNFSSNKSGSIPRALFKSPNNTLMKEEYNFGSPIPSRVDPKSIDDKKVNGFRSSFIF